MGIDSIVTFVIGVAGAGYILWKFRGLDRARHDEDNARTFLEEHGHWPDETPEEAARRLAATAAAPPVAEPDEDGRV